MKSIKICLLFFFFLNFFKKNLPTFSSMHLITCLTKQNKNAIYVPKKHTSFSFSKINKKPKLWVLIIFAIKITTLTNDLSLHLHLDSVPHLHLERQSPLSSWLFLLKKKTVNTYLVLVDDSDFVIFYVIPGIWAMTP